MPPGVVRLSKSRVLAGLQCHKRLWWTVHELGAPELQPGRRASGAVAKYEGGERRVDVVEFIEICKAIEADPHKLLKVLIQCAA
jgi:hypothetical protein